MTTSCSGCDALGITHVDAILPDSTGEPYGDQERHLPARGGQRGPVAPSTRTGAEMRQRRMVVSRHVTINNYEYQTSTGASPGRQHRVRGPSNGDYGKYAVRRGRPPPVRNGGR